VRADLNNSAGVTRRLHHGTALVNGVTDRLFDVDVSARFHRLNHRQRMPVIGGSHDRDLRLLLGEHFTEILILLRLVSAQLRHLGCGRVELVLINVAHSDYFGLPGCNRRPQNIHSPPACPDEGCGVLLALRSQ